MKRTTLLATLALAAASPQFARAQTYQLLYTFTGGADGKYAVGKLLLHGGTLYGTTEQGGLNGLGTVFALDIATRSETVLHSFNGVDGSTPYYEALVRDSAGNLYGTTYSGGASGDGTVFKLDASGNLTTLHSFSGGSTDGANPTGGLLLEKGDLYGTTRFGGSSNLGIVFRVNATTGRETVLCNNGGADGGDPYSTLVSDGAGNLYGTTSGAAGGATGTGFGVVFKVNISTRQETVLYAFTGGADGADAYEGVIRDSAGNLYGSTAFDGASGYGTVFKLDTAGNLTTLHTFTGGADGAEPLGILLRDSSGNLYGTTYKGAAYDGGTVFKLDTSGNLTTLYTFTRPSATYGGLIMDSRGRLYGATYTGGLGYGTVYRVTP